MANFNVSLKKLTEKVSLDVVYTPKGLEEINVEIAEVNRPGLFLAGYYDYFDKLRLQRTKEVSVSSDIKAYIHLMQQAEA